MSGNLKQCMNCGHSGWNSRELKNGLCPECYENEMYNFSSEEEQNELEYMSKKLSDQRL